MSSLRVRALALGSTVALAGGLVAVSSGAVSAAPKKGPRAATAWVATATKSMTSMMNVLKVTKVGATPADTPVSLAIGLRVRDAAGLKSFARQVNTPDSPIYRQWLTPAEFNARYAPASSQVSAVTSYLKRQGFTGISVAGNRLYVSAFGTAAQAEAAFNTQLESYKAAGTGRTVYANVTPAEVPSSLGGTVVSVLGLENMVSFHYHPLVNAKATAALRSGKIRAGATAAAEGCQPTTYALCSYTPKVFWKAYDVGSTPMGSGSTIAIMAEGDLSSVTADLRQAETAWGLPKVPYSIVPVGVPSPDTSGADEWDLDTQYSTGMAGTVKHLYIYDTTSLTDSDIGLEFNKWVSQDVAQSASASFGECEQFPYLDGLMVSNDEAMNEAAAQGQTMHASAGDTGGQSCAVAPTNGAPESGLPEVNYPCASPYIVCVGGTTLFTNTDGSYSEEIAWVAGGGGNSAYEYSPYWQSCVTPTNAGENEARDVPDIAMDADENTGAVVYVGGTPEVVGGTSLSSPLALGVWARLLTHDTKRLGFASPRLYSLYPPPTACVNGVPTPPTSPLSDPPYPFHDVYAGSNGAYSALPGWDYTTGLGSYDVSAVARKICSDSDHDCDPPSRDPDK
jgi:pseudomonalisin